MGSALLSRGFGALDAINSLMWSSNVVTLDSLIVYKVSVCDKLAI